MRVPEKTDKSVIEKASQRNHGTQLSVFKERQMDQQLVKEKDIQINRGAQLCSLQKGQMDHELVIEKDSQKKK